MKNQSLRMQISGQQMLDKYTYLNSEASNYVFEFTHENRDQPQSSVLSRLVDKRLPTNPLGYAYFTYGNVLLSNV